MPFACAQRLRLLPTLAQRITSVAITACGCSTHVCLPPAKYQHPRWHARCAHNAGINGDVVWLYSRREKSTWWMLDSSRRCAAEQPSMLKTQVAKLGIGNARACPDGAVAHSCRSELEGRSPGERADRPQSQHEREACLGIDSKARDPGFESLNFLSV